MMQFRRGHGIDPLSYLGPLDDAMLYRALLGYGIADQKYLDTVNADPFRRRFRGRTASDWRRGNPTEPGRVHALMPFVDFSNGGRTRRLMTPNPFALEHLARYLATYWPQLKRAFALHGAEESYCVSVKHLTGLNEPPTAQDYGFANLCRQELDRPKVGEGLHCSVHLDVVGYSASFDTPIIRRAIEREADAIGLDDLDAFIRGLDLRIRAVNGGASKGYPLGPEAFHLLQHLVSTSIDRRLWAEGFRYVRLFDDYHATFRTEEEGRRFMATLERELNRVGLALNRKKSWIHPHERPSERLREVTGFELSHPATCEEVAGLVRVVYRDIREGRGGNKLLLLLLQRILQAGVSEESAHLLAGTLMRTVLLSGDFFADKWCYRLQMALDDLHPRTLDRGLFTDYTRDVLRRMLAMDRPEHVIFMVSNAKRYGLDVVDALVELGPRILSLDNVVAKALTHRYLRDFADGYAGPGASLMRDLEAQAEGYLGDERSFDEHWLFPYEVLDESRFRAPGPDATAWDEIKGLGISFIA